MANLYSRFVIAGLALLVLIEVAVRVSGITDFPLYDVNAEIGYIPKPSQAGDFLRTNHWEFNSKSMGAPEFTPSDAVDNLLIGDSIVAGGNPYRQEDKLGPQLSKVLQQPVWPISAGSWGLRNELTYLKLHPEVLEKSDRLIFVLNSGDFDIASSWSCEKTHPRTYPIWASLYVFRKYVWDWAECGNVPKELLVAKGSWKPELRQFLSRDQIRAKQVVFFLYPDRDELSGHKSLKDLEAHALEIINLSTVQVSIFSIGRDARWKPEFYKDGIHPSVEGIRVLAEVIGAPTANATLHK